MFRSSWPARPSTGHDGASLEPAGAGTAARMPRSTSPSGDISVADEHELVRRCLLRDPAAWRTLYERHFGKVARLVHALGIVDNEADDLCQEIFIIVYRHLGSFRGESRL